MKIIKKKYGGVFSNIQKHKRVLTFTLVRQLSYGLNGLAIPDMPTAQKFTQALKRKKLWQEIKRKPQARCPYCAQ